jgi:hypothetical protein
MKRFIYGLLFTLLFTGNSWAAILVMQPNGTFTTKPTLAAAAVAADTAGKTVVVTSALSAVQSNISSATVHSWPADRRLKVVRGGKIANTTLFRLNDEPEAGRYQIFSGTGRVFFTVATGWDDHAQTGGAVVFPEWWGSAVGAVQTAAYAVAGQTAATTSPTYFGGKVSLANAHYAINTTLVIPDHVIVEGPSPGSRQSAIVATASWSNVTDPVVRLGRVLGTQYWSHGSQIRNCTVDANLLANVGIYSNSANEESGVDGAWVRDPLKKGIHFEDTNSGATDPRLIHSFIKNVSIYIPVANASAAPSFSNISSTVMGVHVSGTKTAAQGTPTNITIDKVTVSASNGQNDASPVLIHAGFKVDGIGGVSITNSHAEYTVRSVLIGDTKPAWNVFVGTFDCYNIDTNGVEIRHNATKWITLRNIYGQSADVTIKDTRSGQARDITDTTVSLYTDGKQYFAGDTDETPNVHISRSLSGSYTPAGGTALLVESTVGTNGANARFIGGESGALYLGTAAAVGSIIGYADRTELTGATNKIKINGLTAYADNAAALAGGLTAGMIYKTATGQLMIVY